MSESMDSIVLGGGCFWCVEAVFAKLPGVDAVVPGYAGGEDKNPSYEEVCRGTTGHAEVIKVTFDPEMISLAEVLDVFWKCHDPTTRDRQGADVGTQYRSVILFEGDEQKKAALESRSAAQAEFSRPIVTEIEPLEDFYPAEDYHHDYFARNPSAPYCAFVIRPKLEKLGLEG